MPMGCEPPPLRKPLLPHADGVRNLNGDSAGQHKGGRDGVWRPYPRLSSGGGAQSKVQSRGFRTIRGRRTQLRPAQFSHKSGVFNNAATDALKMVRASFRSCGRIVLAISSIAAPWASIHNDVVSRA